MEEKASSPKGGHREVVAGSVLDVAAALIASISTIVHRASSRVTFPDGATHRGKCGFSHDSSRLLHVAAIVLNKAILISTTAEQCVDDRHCRRSSRP
jgi:hypothetical protein